MTEQALWRVIWRGILLLFTLVLLVFLVRELRAVIVQLLLAILLAAAASRAVDAMTVSERATRWR